MRSADEYVELMDNLNLPNPKMMDVAVPANMHQGLAQEEIARRGWAVTAAARRWRCVGRPDVALIDLREQSERDKHGSIPGALHAPYPDLQDNIGAGGMLHELAAATGKRLVFYCAFGERSAMAVQAAQDAGLDRLPHRGRDRGVAEGGREAGALTGMMHGCHPGGGGGRVPVSWEVRLVPKVDLRRTAGKIAGQATRICVKSPASA